MASASTVFRGVLLMEAASAKERAQEGAAADRDWSACWAQQFARPRPAPTPMGNIGFVLNSFYTEVIPIGPI